MTKRNLFNEVYYSSIDPPLFILMKKCGFGLEVMVLINFESDLKFHFRDEILTHGYRQRDYRLYYYLKTGYW